MWVILDCSGLLRCLHQVSRAPKDTRLGEGSAVWGGAGAPGSGPSLGRTSPGSRGGGARPWKEEAGERKKR